MKNLIISYDNAADVLYISLGKPRKAVGREISSGVIERVDPKSGKLVGFTIIDVSKKKKVEIPIETAL